MLRNSCVAGICFGLLLMVVALVADAAPPVEKKEPEWMPAVRQRYELKDDEYVKRVAKPWISERVDFHLSRGTPPKDPTVAEANRARFVELQDWMTIIIDQDGRSLKERHTISHAGL